MSNDLQIPFLPIIQILNGDYDDRMDELKEKIRGFLNSVFKITSMPYDEGNHIVVEERLKDLSNILPSSSMAKAIAIKVFHKKKLEMMHHYLSDPETKKMGISIVKDLAKDSCYDELALLSLAEDTHQDLIEQIGAIRSVLSTHKAELMARVSFNQT